MQRIVVKFTMQMPDDELDCREITTGLGRFESDKAGYVKAPLIVSRLLSGSTHREDADLVSIVFLKTTPRGRASRRSKIDDRESRILTTFPPHYSFMLNALTFGTRIENLIAWLRQLLALLPIRHDLLSIIYFEINKWTNFYNKFYILRVHFEYIFRNRYFYFF